MRRPTEIPTKPNIAWTKRLSFISLHQWPSTSLSHQPNPVSEEDDRWSFNITTCYATSDPTPTGSQHPKITGKDGDDDDDDASQTSYNLAALFLFVIVVMAIGGNVLVCLAVCCKRKLQSMFNYFLVSLALSDMMSGALVMPLSIIRMTTVDLLAVPKLLCVGWYSLDVLLTSSTICHLCMISIDRYLTLTYPLKYGHAKKKKHTLWKIAAVWIISFCIAGPLFILSMLDTYHDTVQYKGCGPETPTFVISATVTSFYLPLFIMTIMYALTVRALQKQLREQRRLTVVNSTRSGPELSSIRSKTSGKSSDQSSGVHRCNSCLLAQRSPLYRSRGSTITGSNHSQPCANASPGSSRDCHSLSYHLLSKSANSQSVKYRGAHPTKSRVTKQLSDSIIASEVRNRNQVNAECKTAEQHLMIGGGSFEGSDVALQDIQDYEVLSFHSNPESPRLESNRFRFNQSFSFRRSLSSTGSSRRGATSPEKSRRAVQVLGILFAVFVICYLPFFAVYLIKGICSVCQPYISPHCLAALEWLAYSGSMLNPIIYHIFNPDFRRAFQTLLTCQSLSRRAGSGNRQRMSEMPLCHIDEV